MINIILFGAGGHCLSCLDVISNSRKYKVLRILDKKIKIIQNYKTSGMQDFIKIKKISRNAHLAFGFIKDPKPRIKLFEKLKKKGFQFPIILSNRSYISTNSKIGEGTIIMHDALLNSESSVGKNCIINSKALIEHGTIIEDHCHISTGAIINGDCRIGYGTFVGSGTIINNGITIGKNCVIGSNLKISKNLKSGSFVK